VRKPTLRPLADQVIVKLIEKPETTAGGIILPRSLREGSQQGRVLAVGSGKRTKHGKVIPVDVVVGDIVTVAKYGGAEVKLGANQKVLIVSESDILAKWVPLLAKRISA